jgi:hypothetical protein
MVSNMGKPDEMISWLEKLGVTGLSSPREDTKEKSDDGLPRSHAKRADTGGGPSPDKAPVRGGGKLVFQPPIGEVELLSVSQADKEGRVFEVTIPNSDKVALLFRAAQAGTSLGTVKISVRGMEMTLREVQVTSIQMGGSGVQIRLDSPESADISHESDP